MDYQKAFNTAYARILKQGRPAIEGGAAIRSAAACFYRMGTCACNFGALIPDELYHQGMEFQGAALLLKQHPMLAAYLEYEEDRDMQFVTALQDCHDQSALSATGEPQIPEEFIVAYKIKMAALAVSYGLKGAS